MPTISLFAVVYFILIAFVSKYPVQKDNLFLSYYDLQTSFILNNLLLFILLIIALVIFFFRFNKRRKNILSRLACFFQKVLFVAVGGSFISFILLFLIAAIQLNILSILSRINLQTIGVKTNTDVIFDQLKGGDGVPNIIFDDGVGRSAIKSAALSQSGKSNYYGGKVIPNLQDILILKEKNIQQNILMAGDVLIIKDINSQEFQKLSPTMGYLMLKDYFAKRPIRSYPLVSLVNKNDYAEFREGNFKDKLETIDELIIKINEDIEKLTLTIGEEERSLSEQEDRLNKEKAENEKEYIRCVNEGYYKDNIYYKINSKEDCLEQKKQREELIKELENGADDIKNSIEKNHQRIVNNREYLKFYKSQKLLTREEVNFILDEYAVFNPPDIIKIIQTTKNSPQALADYFVVLIHEYLHYTTYDQGGESLGSLFFTEGLTEYFARKIVEKNLGLETNMAYPVNVKIIEQMMKRISESDISVIYFTNDSDALEKLIDMVYEEGFYRDNLITLETLQYTGDSKKILELANEIMVKIGGEVLTKEDIVSDNTTFH